MVSPILPFTIGALMSRNEIVDRQDELTGQIVDTVAENYLAKSGEEKVRLKKWTAKTPATQKKTEMKTAWSAWPNQEKYENRTRRDEKLNETTPD